MAFLAHPRLALFLLAFVFSWLMVGPPAAAAAAFPVPEGPVWKQSKINLMSVYSRVNPTVLSGGYTQPLQAAASADSRKNPLYALLSGLADRASRRNQAPLSKQEKVMSMPRGERSAFLQPSVREKAPCKNFFWKTFSSC